MTAVHQRSGTPTAARYVKTCRGLVLFNEHGCFVGIVEQPNGVPDFGPAGDTVLLNRTF
ncbi:MAG: hypothetical protein R3282_10855 [Rhodothermales bacterium]|nr:hypothetical protein [Rhodothermales bacterium]